jgi:hypothetical protein
MANTDLVDPGGRRNTRIIGTLIANRINAAVKSQDRSLVVYYQ